MMQQNQNLWTDKLYQMRRWDKKLLRLHWKKWFKWILSSFYSTLCQATRWESETRILLRLLWKKWRAEAAEITGTFWRLKQDGGIRWTHTFPIYLCLGPTLFSSTANHSKTRRPKFHVLVGYNSLQNNPRIRSKGCFEKFRKFSIW